MSPSLSLTSAASNGHGPCQARTPRSTRVGAYGGKARPLSGEKRPHTLFGAMQVGNPMPISPSWTGMRRLRQYRTARSERVLVLRSGMKCSRYGQRDYLPAGSLSRARDLRRKTAVAAYPTSVPDIS
eukprot:1491650-Rhodomonas_salina.1